MARVKNWHPWALLAPAVSAVFFLLVIPVCFIVVYSFWLRAPSGADIPAFQFGNYQKFFADTFYPSILVRTIRVALECVILCLVLGYIPAYYFYRSQSRFKQVFLLLIMLPFWISFIIRTMSWINIMGDSGLINHFLMALGLLDGPISMLYNEGTVLMGLIMYLLPFMILNIYVSLEGIDKSLLEAARSMGCTEWQAFREVTLPLSLPGVSAGALLVFVLNRRHVPAAHDPGRAGQRDDRQPDLQTGDRHPGLAFRVGHQRDAAGPALHHRLDLQPILGHQPHL